MYVALTFDDGPHPEITPKILDVLSTYQAKATFFMIGQHIERYPDLAARVAAEGHEIGNHTWTHPDLTKLDEQQIRDELERTAQLITSVCGRSPVHMRPPFGASDERVQAIVDTPQIFWSVDPADWRDHEADILVERVTEQMHDGAIILMHDFHDATLQAAERIVASYTSQGYQFVTVSELLGFSEDTSSLRGQIFRSKNA